MERLKYKVIEADEKRREKMRAEMEGVKKKKEEETKKKKESSSSSSESSSSSSSEDESADDSSAEESRGSSSSSSRIKLEWVSLTTIKLEEEVAGEERPGVLQGISKLERG